MIRAEHLIKPLYGELVRAEKSDPTVAFARYNEHHLHYALARGIEDRGARWIVLEGAHRAYKRNLCDVYAEWDNGELWVELKRGWHGYGKGWNSKPGEQLESWLWDLCRLRRITGPKALRALVLVHFRQACCERAGTPAPDPQLVEKIAKRITAGKGITTALPRRVSAWQAPELFARVLERLSVDYHESSTVAGRVRSEGGAALYRFFAGVF